MAIDFSQVKKIMIPEGEVTKIQINGVTVWENAPVLTSITLSGQTTSLNRGAAFSFGGTVTAHYSNGSTANVTSSTTFSGYNMSKAGTYTVTASYTENGVTKTATYSLTVNKAWTAVWTGNKSVTNNGSSIASVDVWTGVTLTGTQTLRFTWSASGSGTGSTQYCSNGSSTFSSAKPSNPFQMNLAMGSSKNYLIGARRYSNGNGEAAYLSWNSSSKKFQFYRTEYGNGGGSITLTLTKIERYY